MKRVEQLIDIARKLSQNTRYDSQSGVPQDVFVQYLNNAQDSLMMEVQNLKTKYFKKLVIVPVVAKQEKYSWPDGCYMQHVDTIQWTDSPSGTYWQTLFKTTTKEKITIQPGYPFAYVPHEDGFYMNPPITRGSLYVTFMDTPQKLQKRAGKINGVGVSSGLLNSLTLDITEASFDLDELNSDNYLCVVDKFGALKAKNIIYDGVDQTGNVNVTPYTMGTSTISDGDYVCVGPNVVNIPSRWPEVCEGYLIKHMVYEARMGDASSWTAPAREDMAMYFQKLSASFSTLSDDVTDIPLNRLDYLGW